ncbi:MAG: sugar ABC transporter substrate-binding protein [Chloroflexia bacterium]
MRVTKRGGFLLSLLTGLSMVLSACGGDNPTATPIAPTATTMVEQATATTMDEATATPGTTGATGEISFQVFGDPPELAAFQAVAKGFETANPGAKVNIIHIPAQGDHMTKLSSSFAAGNPPDVFIINYRRYGQFAAKGVIEPAGPLMAKSTLIKEADYYPQVLDAFRYKGTLMCVPQNISNLVVYYNKDMFTKANVAMPTSDWTWNDFLTAAQALTKDNDGDGVIDQYGVGVETQLIRVAPFVWGNGGEIVDNYDKPTTLTLDTPEARDAVQFFIDLQVTHKVAPSEAEATAEDAETRFMNNRLGMVLNSRAATPTFREIKGFEWDVAPIPMQKQKSTILHSDAYCMAAASPPERKALAWQFVEYAQGKEGQTIAARLGRTVPSRMDVAQSDAFLDPTKSPASSQVFLDMIPHMRLIPIISTWPQVETVVNEELERAFYNLVPLDQAIKQATEDTKPLFAEAETAK